MSKISSFYMDRIFISSNYIMFHIGNEKLWSQISDDHISNKGENWMHNAGNIQTGVQRWSLLLKWFGVIYSAPEGKNAWMQKSSLITFFETIIQGHFSGKFLLILLGHMVKFNRRSCLSSWPYIKKIWYENPAFRWNCLIFQISNQVSLHHNVMFKLTS